MSHHRITWTLDHDTIIGSVSCSAPTGADCRLACPLGCERWPCGHDLTDHGLCNAAQWFDAEGHLPEFYAGDDQTTLRDGPVQVSWDGDAYVWTYGRPAPHLSRDELIRIVSTALEEWEDYRDRASSPLIRELPDGAIPAGVVIDALHKAGALPIGDPS